MPRPNMRRRIRARHGLAPTISFFIGAAWSEALRRVVLTACSLNAPLALRFDVIYVNSRNRWGYRDLFLSKALPLSTQSIRTQTVRVQTHVRLLGSPVSGWSLAGEAWPRPYGDPTRSQLRWRARHGLAPTGAQRGANCAGGRGMASPLQAPNAEPIALAGEAWPRPYGDPTRSQLRRGEAMPRPPASNRGCPDPVSQVMNQHANLTK